MVESSLASASDQLVDLTSVWALGVRGEFAWSRPRGRAEHPSSRGGVSSAAPAVGSAVSTVPGPAPKSDPTIRFLELAS